MLRKFVSEIFGFNREIDELNRRIQELSWDEPFGMWTRSAFLQFCRIMPRGKRTVVFIDLDDIHGMNHRLGYTEVDRRVKQAFSIPFRRSDIVARWYSGDEIVVLFDSDRKGAEKKVEELRRRALELDLSFSSEIGMWNVSKKSIEEIVEMLSDRNRRRLEPSRRPGSIRRPGA